LVLPSLLSNSSLGKKKKKKQQQQQQTKIKQTKESSLAR
jgi:hypothetical protein